MAVAYRRMSERFQGTGGQVGGDMRSLGSFMSPWFQPGFIPSGGIYAPWPGVFGRSILHARSVFKPIPTKFVFGRGRRSALANIQMECEAILDDLDWGDWQELAVDTTTDEVYVATPTFFHDGASADLWGSYWAYTAGAYNVYPAAEEVEFAVLRFKPPGPVRMNLYVSSAKTVFGNSGTQPPGFPSYNRAFFAEEGLSNDIQFQSTQTIDRDEEFTFSMPTSFEPNNLPGTDPTQWNGYGRMHFNGLTV